MVVGGSGGGSGGSGGSGSGGKVEVVIEGDNLVVPTIRYFFKYYFLFKIVFLRCNDDRRRDCNEKDNCFFWFLSFFLFRFLFLKVAFWRYSGNDDCARKLLFFVVAPVVCCVCVATPQRTTHHRRAT